MPTMAKQSVYVLDTYHDAALSILRESPSINLIYRDDPKIKDWQSEADGLMVRSETRVTAAELKDAKKLKVVVKQGVGVDNIDVEAAKQQGIAVCNTPALNSEAVAESRLQWRCPWRGGSVSWIAGSGLVRRSCDPLLSDRVCSRRRSELWAWGISAAL